MAKPLRYLIPTGFLRKTRDELLGYYNFDRVIAEILNRLSVPFNDKCCPGIAKRIPVSVNPVTGAMEFFDADDNTWKAVTAFTPTTTTTTTNQ
jgi:hypothetical protein